MEIDSSGHSSKLIVSDEAVSWDLILAYWSVEFEWQAFGWICITKDMEL